MLNVTEKANWKNEAKWSILAVCVLLLLWWFWPEPITPVGETKIADEAKEVKGEPKTEIKPAKVQAYQPKVKNKLGLPQAVQADAKAHVLSASKVRGDDHPHTITTVLNEQTGEVTTYDRRDPLPWFALGGQKAVAIGHGFKSGKEVSWVSARADLVQVKALRLQVVGMAFSDTQWVAGGQIEWRF